MIARECRFFVGVCSLFQQLELLFSRVIRAESAAKLHAPWWRLKLRWSSSLLQGRVMQAGDLKHYVHS